MKVCFETFGCRLNRAEALQQEAEYLANGWTRTTEHREADLIIVRGCSVTRRAQHDCEKMIAHLRKHYPLKALLIEGCLSKIFKTANSSVSSRIAVGTADGENAAVPTRTARAYLKVQDGCSGKCAFCIVPQFRGTSVSVPFRDVLSKAEKFIAAGYHEIVLTGCNLSLYASEGRRLPELVAALAMLSRGCRYRIGSLEPGSCAAETVDAMAENPNICRFLHLPIQSGSNRILQSMRRPYLTTAIDDLVKKIQKTFPVFGLGCDIMTGFPGETEVDFIMTQGLIKRHPFSNVHIFPYSERPNTVAAGLPQSVPHEIRHSRARFLTAMATERKSKVSKDFIGRDVGVIIEDEKKLIGWTGEYFQCEITNKSRARDIKRRDLVTVHVMDAHHGHLKAVLI